MSIFVWGGVEGVPLVTDNSYIRATQLIGFAEFVEACGGNARFLLDKSGIDRTALTNVDQMISFPKFAALLEIASKELKRPAFGLEWSLKVPYHTPNLGPIALLMVGVPTVGERIKIGIEYLRYHTNAFTLRIVSDEADEALGRARLRYTADSSVLPARQICEHLLGLLCVQGRISTGGTLEKGMIVCFQHDKPADTKIHDEVFGCPVEFNADHNEIIGERSVLQFDVTRMDLSMQTLVRLYMSFRMARLPVYRPSVTATVNLTIQSIIGTGKCTLDFVAAALNMNPKRLQRKLTAEGVTFSDLLEKVRENMARRLLIESEIPVERLAGLLDYTGTPPFTTAFKRWTGQSPLAFRKQFRALDRSES